MSKPLMKKHSKIPDVNLPTLFDNEPAAEEPTPLLSQLNLVRPLVFFDLETTGLDPAMDRIVQFAFIRVQPDHSIDEWSALVNPCIPIPKEASRVHHITDEMVANEPSFSEFAPQVRDFINGSDLAGFNILRFDVPFLAAEMERNGCPMDLSQIQVVDSQVIFHRREPRDLSAAYRLYCREEMANAHDALADVRATARVLAGQLGRYADLPRETAGLAEYCSSDNNDRWVTADRKFYWRHGEPVLAFGKHKGKSLKWLYENELDYLRWMSEKDFTEETLTLIQAALQGRFPQKSTKE
jgi:DNA polymerase III subunit epsilon